LDKKEYPMPAWNVCVGPMLQFGVPRFGFPPGGRNVVRHPKFCQLKMLNPSTDTCSACLRGRLIDLARRRSIWRYAHQSPTITAFFSGRMEFCFRRCW
jgi:hypothetical protein